MLKTYVLNLDRHVSRLKTLGAQLDAQNIVWHRFRAIDGAGGDEAYLNDLVAPQGPIPRMPTGARACTASHILILRDFVASNAEHALVLEDDAEPSPRLGVDLAQVIRAAPTGVLNINRQPSSGAKKKIIVRKAGNTRQGAYDITDLIGIHYGTAGYVVDKASAQTILDMYPHPDIPIDHMLFNPNISRLSDSVPVRQLFPALVRPAGGLVSSIQEVPVAKSDTIRNKLKRARSEFLIVPRVLAGLLLGRYEIKVLEF